MGLKYKWEGRIQGPSWTHAALRRNYLIETTRKKWDPNPCLYANLEFPKVTRKAIILTSQVKSFSEVAVVVSFTLFLLRFFVFDLVCV